MILTLKFHLICCNCLTWGFFSRVNPATGDLHVSLHRTNICFKAVKFAPRCICCPSHSEPDKRGTVLNIKSHLQTQYLLQHKTLTASISSSWPQDGVKTKCLDLQQVHVVFFLFQFRDSFLCFYTGNMIYVERKYHGSESPNIFDSFSETHIEV